MKIAIYCIVAFAVIFNAALAFFNANISRISVNHVMGGEAILIAAAAVVVHLSMNAQRDCRFVHAHFRPLIFLGLFLALYIANLTFSSLAGESTSLKPIRDVLIIFAFLMVGFAAASYRLDVRWPFIALTAAVVVVGLLEFVNTPLYIRLFNVASYYSQTRGDGQETLAGIFENARSFNGRFSFGFRQAQRLSSVFLEQTTHGNYAVLICVFLAGFWNRLSLIQRFFLAGSALFIILGTDSRQAFAVCLIVSLSYAVVHRFGRWSLFVYMPGALIFMLLGFYDPEVIYRSQDNFDGRLTYSIGRFVRTDMEAMLGIRMGERVFDSGYTYILYGQAIWGFIAFLILLPAVLPYGTASARRFSHAVMIFYTVNLSVSGSTIFSIKTAAVLWFLIGLYAATEALQQRRQVRAGALFERNPIAA